MDKIKYYYWLLENYDVKKLNDKLDEKDAYILLRNIILPMMEEVNFNLNIEGVVMETQIEEDRFAVYLWERNNDNVILENFNFYYRMTNDYIGLSWASRYGNPEGLKAAKRMIEILEEKIAEGK